MNKLIYLSFFLFPLQLFAQVTDIGVQTDTRFDDITAHTATRLQQRVRLGFTIDAKGLFELVGIVTTGTSFNNDWSSFHNFNQTENEKLNLAFRNLYLRKVMGDTSLEAGALTPEPIVGAAGLPSSGWMDGVRVKQHTNLGDFKIVFGSLTDFKNPNVFARDLKANFLEIEISKQLFEKLTLTSAYENLDQEDYLRAEAKWDMTILTDKVFTLIADALYHFNQHASNYEVGVQMDVLKNFLHKYDNRLNAKVYYSNLDAKLVNRSSMVTAFYTYGPRTTVQFDGKIDHDGKFTWFTRGVFGDQKSRFDLGATVKFGHKKKK